MRACKPGAKSKTLEIAAEYVKDGPKPITVVVMGCMAERFLKSMQKDYPVVDYVVGTYAKKQFGEIIEAVEGKRSSRDVNLSDDPEQYEFSSVSLEPGAFSAFVPIMHGCNNFCTYCIVPYVRGREKSRSVEDILKEIDFLSKAGVKEITVLGQNVNSYGKDHQKATFAQLLEMVDKVEGIQRVRYMTSHPKDLSNEVIEVIKNSKHICRHFHLPVQYGSNRILKAMNRVYTVEQYRDLVARIRAAVPEASLTTDLIVGFPGETEEDFQQLMTFIEEIRYDQAYTFIYSKRSGTPAAEMDNQA